MIQRALILHGRPSRDEYYDTALPSASNAHWLPWLQKQLMIRDIHAQTPEMFRAFDPQWDVWLNAIERHKIDEHTILVGHSTGAGFWIRFLSERPELKVGKVVLVAPWLGTGSATPLDFFQFSIDPHLVSRTQGISVLYSDDDMPMILSSVNEIKAIIKGVKIMALTKKGHFCETDLGTKNCPEVLAAIFEK
jgi:uncharacterized protein